MPFITKTKQRVDKSQIITLYASVCVKMKDCAGIGERSNPADCKSAALCFVGSNPTPCTRQDAGLSSNRGAPSPHSSVVERILGKNEVPSSSLGVGSIKMNAPHSGLTASRI